MLVDATTVTVVCATSVLHGLDWMAAFGIILMYDLLAFAGQAPLGYLIDTLRAPRAAVMIGLAGCALAAVFMGIHPYAAMVLAGIGNALFHVGAGALTLHTDPGRATDPGIFVGPGSLGLGFGLWFGHTGNPIVWPFLVLLGLSFVVVKFLVDPEMPYGKTPSNTGPDRPDPTNGQGPIPLAAIIVALLLISVAIRSGVGMASPHLLPRDPLFMLGIPIALCLGKSLGGVVCDRIGWIEGSVGALLLSAPLLAYGGGSTITMMIGLFLFSLTMPVTLVAVAEVFPGKPAFAFGLCCLAFVSGAVPTFYAEVQAFYHPDLFLALVLTSAVCILFGLRWLGGDRIRLPKLLPGLYS